MQNSVYGWGFRHTAKEYLQNRASLRQGVYSESQVGQREDKLEGGKNQKA